MDYPTPQIFLDEFVPRFKALTLRANVAYWDATTTGSPEAEKIFATTKAELMKLFSNPEHFQYLQHLQEQPPADPIIRRQLDLLYHGFLANQLSPETIEKIVNAEQAIESIFTKFRAEFRGVKTSDNNLKAILRNSTNSDECKEAWLASKSIATETAGKIRELVKIRNQAAQSLGFPDYYALSLTTAELDEKELFDLLDRLKQETDVPFQAMKLELDVELAERFGIRPEELHPWHYGDPFFQEVPATGEIPLDAFFADQDPVALAKRYYEGLGLQVQAILDRSDLYEREGKQQHAYCTDIDRQGDVRILCNLRPNEQETSTLLHELGHSVYDQDHDQALPFLLREPAHIFTTEAVAMLMGRFTKDPAWLNRIAGIPSEQLPEKELKKLTIRGSLIFIRWGLVVVYFERAMYRNPDLDLDSLWWQLVHDLQGMTPPEGHQASDWASKIHIGTVPVYYQNYILGELFASQLHAHLKKAVGGGSIIDQPKAGRFLKERIFKPGTRMPWQELIREALGEDLDPKYLAEEMMG
ncbi:MAG TPA: M2 family metallopeptidase [Bacillota bacterium]|nr:M2 family metallopeptidase [Bacillota bacterium]